MPMPPRKIHRSSSASCPIIQLSDPVVQLTTVSLPLSSLLIAATHITQPPSQAQKAAPGRQRKSGTVNAIIETSMVDSMTCTATSDTDIHDI